MSEHRCLSCEDWQRRDAANKAEITRLREAIIAFDKYIVKANDLDPLGSDDEVWFPPEVLALCRIAREGR